RGQGEQLRCENCAFCAPPAARIQLRRGSALRRNRAPKRMRRKTRRRSPSVGTDFVQNLRPLSTAGSHFPGVASMLAGIAVEFWLFALTLLGIALTHRYTLQVALAGLAVIVAYKLFWAGF